VNVITKSGGNTFHGNVYEYFRNTILDSRGYPDTTKPQLNQNQFGGTFGGPIKKDRTFFFASFEGRRIRNGQPGQLLNVPSGQEFGGDFSDQGAFAGGITPGGFVAQVLDGRSGCDAALGQTVSGIRAGSDGLADWSTIFPTNVIPAACQDPVAANLLQKFVPQANIGSNQNQVVPVGTDNANQFTVRIDHKINDHQNFTAYYYFNDGHELQPYDTFEASGANVPGFGNLNNLRNQQWNFTHNWTISNAVVNEAHFTYMRQGELGFIKPQTTGLVT
jgi:hypothetical protein